MTPVGRGVQRPRRTVRRVMGAALGAALLVTLAGYVLWRYMSGAPMPQARHTVVVTVPEGAPASTVARILQSSGVIRSAWAFLILAGVDHLDARLQPGPYRMSSAWPLRTVLSHLAQNDILIVRVTVPEGFTVSQIEARLVADGIGSPTAVAAAVKQAQPPGSVPSGVRDPIEGFLFPDTYLIPYGTAPKAAIAMMQHDFLVRTRALRHELPPGESVWQWVTLASIVQAEDRDPVDAPLIAAVFANRLRVGMPLQSDATVRYALFNRVKGGLSLQDLTVRSAYNTYVHTGLPPGPIDCPGLMALNAALHPAHVGYLYFVSTPSGGDLFATTYQQHQLNMAKVAAMTKSGS